MSLPLSSVSIDRRDDIVRLLAGTPDGLSDAALADALGDGVRPGSVNALCRRMASAGVLERVGSRPIRNRLVAAPDTVEPAAPEPAVPEPDEKPGATVARRTRRQNGSAPEKTAAEPGPAEASPAEASPAEASPEGEKPTATVARRTRRKNGSAPEKTAAEPGPATAEADRTSENLPTDRPDAVDIRSTPVLVPDVAQAWSRPVNVQAALASWLTGRGATIRGATDGDHGPARDLVVSLDGDDVHVEITGWPPDGARTHPTTIAGDWFAAAEHAAVARRRSHPHARIVIALPDTRRYRALSTDRAAALAGARAEVWFVDPSGAVEQGAHVG